MNPELSFDEYGKKAHSMAFYNASVVGAMPDLVYAALGMMGEAGEVSEKIKKLYRDKRGEWTNEDKVLFQKELGDVLWYLNELAILSGSTLEGVACVNLQKLRDRQERNVLKGDGDSR